MGNFNESSQPQANDVRPSNLGAALFTETQQRVLGYLFGQPHRSFYAKELMKLTGSGSGAAQRELKRLEDSGLVTARWLGNQKHYQANPKAPIYSELCSIAQKTFGLAGPIGDALSGLSSHIRAAFIYGSVAKHTEHAQSDIDLMILSDELTHGDLISVLAQTEDILSCRINPTIYGVKDFALRLEQGNNFLKKVIAGPKLWIIGSEADLGA
jgi:predicted nucleotidyltransferase